MTQGADDAVDRLSFDELKSLLREIFLAHGASDEVAACLADNCATAEGDGALSHGVFRMPGYVSTLRSGWVDGRATAQVRRASGSTIRVDAMNGFAQPALQRALALAEEICREQGVALVLMHDSHHFGALWPDLEPLARKGLVALTMVNGYATVAPFGATRRVYGTNPMAFAAPRGTGDPLIFDQATSAMSQGDTRIAARDGRPLPPGVGIDSEGLPTTDPNQVLNGGALQPFGGHKGSSIGMMIEILAGALTGAAFSFELDRSGHPGAETSRSGQVLILADPKGSRGADLASRVDVLARTLQAAGQSRLPGDHRYARRRETRAGGIPIGRPVLDGLRRLLAEGSAR